MDQVYPFIEQFPIMIHGRLSRCCTARGPVPRYCRVVSSQYNYFRCGLCNRLIGLGILVHRRLYIGVKWFKMLVKVEMLVFRFAFVTFHSVVFEGSTIIETDVRYLQVQIPAYLTMNKSAHSSFLLFYSLFNIYVTE